MLNHENYMTGIEYRSVVTVMVIIYRIGGLFYIHNRTVVRVCNPNTSISTARQIFNSIHNFSPNPPNHPYVYRKVYRKIPINTTFSSSSSYSNHPIFTLSHPHIPHKSSHTNGSSDRPQLHSHPNHHFPCIINVFHLIHPTLRYTLFHLFDSQLHSS